MNSKDHLTTISSYLIHPPRFLCWSWHQESPGKVSCQSLVIPHINVGFLFSLLACRPVAVAVSRPPRLRHLNSQLLISHHSSHTTHLTHNSSHTQLISHTTHLNSSHTTHLTQLISHNSSHAPHLTDVLLGRRSTQSLLTEVRRGLAPQCPRLLVAWQAQYREPPEGAAARIGAAVAAATCCVAGAVQRASWRSCGADWRRGRGCLLCSRRSTQSLLQELRRGLAPQWPRLLVAWQAQYKEPPEGASARIGAAVAAAACCVAGAVRSACYRSCGADWRRSARGYLLRGRRSTESLLKELRRGLAPPWPRLVVAWQAQYSEPPEGAAARIGAAVAASCCVAGAVHRASWRSWGADWRRRGRSYLLRGRRSAQSFLKELRRGLAPPWPRLLVAWQAQYTQPPEGAAARIGAAVAAAGLSPLWYWRLQKRCLRDRYASPQFH